MDSDEVNSISDTPESQQVAGIIKDSYQHLVASLDVAEHYSLFELDASGTATYPAIMHAPSNCLHIEWLKYMASEIADPAHIDLDYIPLKEFMDRNYLLDVDDSNVEYAAYQFTTGSFTGLFWYNDRQPSCYTTPDDFQTIIFDAYDSSIDTTLQKTKTVAFGKLSPTFTLSDSFTVNLDEQQIDLLYNEAKAQCFAELKQQQNVIADRRARKGWVRAQRSKEVHPYSFYSTLPNYGRR
jgi:hypothetical protein